MIFFIAYVISGIAFYSTGCLGANDDGSALLQESIEHLVNYTSHEALEFLNLKSIGSDVASIAYNGYKAKLGYEYPRHCNDFNKARKPPTSSGIAIIKPDDGEPFPVYCVMDKFGGGWIRILYRSSTKMSFNLDWYAYKNGFGNLGGNGWLGLEKIYRLTKHQPASLLVSLYYKNGYWYYPQYKTFQVGSEATKYQLRIGNFTGDGGDSLSFSHHAKFSTYDKDHDSSSSNCANSYRGGWWYYNCAQGKLTGDPYASSTSNYYVKWPGLGSYALPRAIMEIKLSDY